jgi:hypothetical protein
VSKDTRSALVQCIYSPIVLAPLGSGGRLTAVATGNVTLDDLTEFVATARTGDQRYLPLFLDLSASTTDMSTMDVQRFADYLGLQTRQFGPRGRVAVFAPEDDVFGVWRMLNAYCEMAGVTHIAVFRTRPEAAAWLDAPASD